MKKVLFHHIPKTAGTSLISSARLHFGERAHNGRYDNQVSEDDITGSDYTFFHGHFTRSFVLRFRELLPDAIIFTILRHPFNRTLSQYFNWVDKTRVLRELDVIRGMSGDSQDLRNLIAKFEQIIFPMSLADFLISDDEDIIQASNNVQSQYMTIADDVLDCHRFHRAPMNAVSFYDFIGVQELYEPCLRMIEVRCGLGAGCLGDGSRENVSDYTKANGRYRVSRRELLLLEARNIYDIALYQTCFALLLKENAEWLPPNASDISQIVNLPELVNEPVRHSA